MFIKSLRGNKRAFTLVEFVVAMGVGSVILIGVASFAAFSNRSFASMANYVDLDQKSRQALDRMTREIRQTRQLIEFSTNKLTFENFDGTKLEYVYSPESRTLSAISNNVSKVLLTECDTLQFSIYQRNPIGGVYDQYPTGDPATCKLVNIHWVCSRTIKGNIANTESVQTAKVVIRKQ